MPHRLTRNRLTSRFRAIRNQLTLTGWVAVITLAASLATLFWIFALAAR